MGTFTHADREREQCILTRAYDSPHLIFKCFCWFTWILVTCTCTNHSKTPNLAFISYFSIVRSCCSLPRYIPDYLLVMLISWCPVFSHLLLEIVPFLLPVPISDGTVTISELVPVGIQVEMILDGDIVLLQYNQVLESYDIKQLRPLVMGWQAF